MSEEKETIRLVEVEATKISLVPGDVLMVTVKSGADNDALAYLNQKLQEFFPNNKIVVFGMGANEAVEFTIANRDESDYTETEEKETTGDANGGPQNTP